jgi:hypothetical protein
LRRPRLPFYLRAPEMETPHDEDPSMGTRWSMAMSSLQARGLARFRLGSVALVPVLIAGASSAVATEVRCVRADQTVRRVAIEVQDPDRDVPCEVVYWKDTEQPGVRTVLWNARTDAAFCRRKAEELVGKLEAVGWKCTAPDEPTEAAARPSPQSEPPDSAQGAAEASVAGASRPAGAGQPMAAPDTQTSAKEATPAVREALAPQRPAGTPPVEGADAPPPATALDAIIEQNLMRLNDGVDGRFAAEIGDYGDLDGDGLDDGLVFFTYESERLGQARFIAAYLFDGESYALAATKPLAGSDEDVQSAAIESIEDGVISLRLNVLEPGDAACCPSGIRQQTLVLRGGQLVEARSTSAAENRS